MQGHRGEWIAMIAYGAATGPGPYARSEIEQANKTRVGEQTAK
jgi:hypothetical protein